MALARGPYICQSQSLNLYLPNPDHTKMTAMHFYGWEKGLKTGMYYLRSRSAVDAVKITVSSEKAAREKIINSQVENNDGNEECLTCSA